MYCFAAHFSLDADSFSVYTGSDERCGAELPLSFH